MRVIVCGGRNFQNKLWINSHLDNIKITELAHGGANGVDSIAGEWAKENGIPVTVFTADWDSLGRAAGPIRNRRMLEEFRPDIVIAFMYGSGNGTKNMAIQAKELGVGVLTI